MISAEIFINQNTSSGILSKYTSSSNFSYIKYSIEPEMIKFEQNDNKDNLAKKRLFLIAYVLAE